jgi:hypothetical protein
MKRRTFVTGTALALPAGLAGCTGSKSNGDGTRPDPGEISVDGRLQNKMDETLSFEVKAETNDGYDIVDDTYEVSGSGTERVAGIGVPGATQTFTILVNGTERTEALTLAIEPADHIVDGYVDIRYTTAEEIELSVTPRDESGDSNSEPVLTGHTVIDVSVTPDVERESDMDSWGVFLATQSIAKEYFDSDDNDVDEVEAFISETAFEQGERLMYVQAFAPQTCYELRLRKNPSIDTNGLPVVDTELNRTASDDEPCGDAITPVDLLVRLSFDSDGPPADVVVVHITDSDGNQQEGFQLEAER